MMAVVGLHDVKKRRLTGLMVQDLGLWRVMEAHQEYFATASPGLLMVRSVVDRISTVDLEGLNSPIAWQLLL